MPSSFNITIDGLSELSARIAAASQNTKAIVNAELQDGAAAIAEDAIKAAPGNYSILRQGIKSLPAGDLNYEVVSNALYSAYVEFGTGHKVSIPSGYEDYAAQFKGANQDHPGMLARPFFIPAFMKNYPKIIANVTKALDKAL